jgi:hypothetical protein
MMSLFTLLYSLPPEIAGSAVLSQVGLVGLARLESAVANAKFRSFLSICYTMVDPIPFPENLPPKAYEIQMRWLLERNLKVCGVIIDDSNAELVPYIVENIQSVSGGIKLQCIKDRLDPFTFILYPELIAKVTDVEFHPVSNGRPTDTIALPFRQLRSLHWHSPNSRNVPKISLSGTIRNNPWLENSLCTYRTANEMTRI